jgi:hypothetical protein
MKSFVVIALTLLLAIFIAAPARADQCKPVVGSFEAQITAEGCTAGPGLLCTSGRVWGGLQGSYFFTMASLVPTVAVAPPNAAVPSIFFFTGNSVVALKDGGHASGIDTGTIDLPFVSAGQGGFASLITFSGPVSGQIRLRGELDPNTGTTSGDYIGTLCTAQ